MKRELVVTTPPAPLYEVPLVDETVWRGTWRELCDLYPEWKDFAREIPAVAPAIELDYADDPRLNRMPRSSINYQTTTGQRVRAEWQPGTVVQRRKSALPARETEEEVRPRPKRKRRGLFRSHPLVWLGLGMLFMLLAWVGLQALGAWWSVHQDDVTYGRPRTAQYDVVLGHSVSATHPTHLIAVNLNSEVVIIELPGGDTAKSIIYKGPNLFGPGSELAPVTLTFKDTTGSGRLDMIVHVQGASILYLNQKVNNVWQFVPQQNR